MTEKKGDGDATAKNNSSNKVWKRPVKRSFTGAAAANAAAAAVRSRSSQKSSRSSLTLAPKASNAINSQNPTPASLEIVPDEALGNILGRISDGRMLARCAGVCRRWRRVCRQVPVLKLVLRKMQAWQAEGVISAALLERKGLRDFEVRFVCPRKYASEGVRESRVFGCLWRLSSSIETLALICPNTVYFKLWTWLAKFPRLLSLKIHCGRIEENPLNNCLNQLRRCEFSRTIIAEPMLEDLVKFSPVLEELVVVGCDPIESLALESSSLRYLNLVATEEYPMKSLELLTLGLKDLYICHVEELQVNGYELVHLGIYSACQPRISSLHHLLSLEMDGKGWALESIEHIVCAAQVVRHLVIKASISETRPLRIEHYLSPMFCLQAVILESNLLECFCRGFAEIPFDGDEPVFALKKVAVKLSEETRDCTGLLKALVSYCPDLQILVVDTTELELGNLSELQQLKDQEQSPQRRVLLYSDPKDQRLVKEIAEILAADSKKV
ncbi:hypothetical protein SELMODRAFT_413935 [Selaginella moellendorffii]|uniref:F-box domain-containing protein n=1 Tax=Selaginella moellendorffii TaxID=88036 RepID=D8RR34_SELML|nr:uncharacterized protein LOC9642581 [Selaginella moellendorffii]EFJ25174.1 hypothetical protein SELMODRAFT_413935 [Selaginella moellendorffii]|eukprot:XP_002973514.1 uncharacterized protein LOC9642581 [Selaginella moellendorffii]